MTTKKTKHQIKSELSYQRFMEASLRLFAEKGYEGASIDAIAKEAGYTKGAFYTHFNTKEEVFLKLMNLRLNAFKDLFVNHLSVDTPFDKFVSSSMQLLGNMTQEHNWIPIFFEFCAHAMRNEQIRDEMTKQYNQWVDLLSQIIQRAKDNGEVPQHVEPERTAQLILIFINGTNLQNKVFSRPLDVSTVEHMIRKLMS